MLYALGVKDAGIMTRLARRRNDPQSGGGAREPRSTVGAPATSRDARSKESSMTAAAAPTTARDKVRTIAPKLIELTEKVIYGDVWERPGLSKRDRSLITVAALVALNRSEQLDGHLGRALDNGVTKDEIVELITHLAFYSGWPTAMSAALLAKEAFEKRQ
jgi:4-carboxymuconolactone decarboxylase